RRARALANLGACGRDRCTRACRSRLARSSKAAACARRGATRWGAARGRHDRHRGYASVPLGGEQEGARCLPASWRGWRSRARLRLSPRLAPLRHSWRRGGVAAACCGTREFGGAVTIHLYTFGWNEMRMIGFFFRHYEPWVDRFIFYDDGSTDGTLELLASKTNVEIRPFAYTSPDSF